MNTELVSAIAAVAASLFSLGSYLVARKALSLEKKRDKRRSVPLNCDLIKGMHKSNGRLRALVFLVSVTNNSSIDTSLLNIFLNVVFIDSENNLKKVKFSHDVSLPNKYGLNDYEFAELHPLINSNQTISKGFIFEYDISLLSNCTFERYEIEFEDNRSNRAILETILTMEIINHTDE